MASIADLIIRISADLKQYEKSLTKMGADFERAGKKMTDTGKALTKGLTVPILGAAVAAVKLASDLEESVNKVDVAFGDSAREVHKWSETTLKSFGIAQGTALDMAATFGDMGTSMGQLPATAADMSTALTGLAGDLASFKNIGIDQAMTALKGVYTGEGEALKTLGIVMQDNTLIAYAQAKGYEKQYKEMTQAEKVALRYAYVMDATKNAQGDFARTSDGVANQMRIAQESIKQAGASLGTQLLPQVAKALQWVNGLVEKFTSLDESTQGNIIRFGLMAASIGPAMTVIGKLTTGVGGLVSKLLSAASAISGGKGFGTALTTMIGPQGLAMLAVGAIALIAVEINRVSAEAKAATSKVESFISSIDRSAESMEAQAREAEASIILAEKLSSELFGLANRELLSNTEKARMVMLVAQLNELMPELNLSIDKQTGLLNMNRSAVDALIASKKQELLLQAGEQQMLAYLQDGIELRIQQQEATERLRLAQEAVNNLPKVQFFSQGAKERYELIEAQKALDSISEAMKRNENRVRAAEDAYSDLAKSMQSAAKAGSNIPIMTGGAAGKVTMKAYAHGTDYVPETGPAILHKGEAVLTAAENRAGRGIVININGPISSESDAERYGQSIVRSLRQAGVTV